ncbi:MAG: primosomal replication protein N [Alcanivoracaceae bacterium]
MTGQVVAIEPVRRTPGGVARQRIWLEHRSRQDEAGVARAVEARIALILAGDAGIGLAAGLREGSQIQVSGFIARSGHRGEAQDRLELHVQALAHLD